MLAPSAVFLQSVACVQVVGPMAVAPRAVVAHQKAARATLKSDLADSVAYQFNSSLIAQGK